MSEERLFPIQDGPSFPWRLIEPYERQAQKNHRQSLERLAERGGLGAGEAIAVLTAQPWRPIENAAEELRKLVNERLDLVPRSFVRAAVEAEREAARPALEALENLIYECPSFDHPHHGRCANVCAPECRVHQAATALREYRARGSK